MTKIGLRNARVLCNMSYNERISFIAEGLPILLASARSSWSAAESLAAMPREFQVLTGLADEEAAKLLILIDIVRCPKEVIASRIGTMTTWFYDHLARLLYSEAQSWRPSNVKELQSYLDSERKAHYLEGDAGEYIMQNWSVYTNRPNFALMPMVAV